MRERWWNCRFVRLRAPVVVGCRLVFSMSNASNQPHTHTHTHTHSIHQRPTTSQPIGKGRDVPQPAGKHLLVINGVGRRGNLLEVVEPRCEVCLRVCATNTNVNREALLVTWRSKESHTRAAHNFHVRFFTHNNKQANLKSTALHCTAGVVAVGLAATAKVSGDLFCVNLLQCDGHCRPCRRNRQHHERVVVTFV